VLRTRLWVGSLLALAAAGILVGDQYLAPWFPCLFVCLMFLGVVATRELVRLFPPVFRPSELLTTTGVLLALAANWHPVVRAQSSLSPASPWPLVTFVLVGVLIAAFLLEMHRYREPGGAVPRVALTVFAVAYLGLLASFLAQLRWVHPDAARTTLILTLTIFVPKGGDVGAFFAGTFFGRHKMTPILSPKKTWEGAVGGLLASVLVAVGLSFAGPVFKYGIPEAVAFGVVLCVAGMLGDLAESLMKRDCQTKDAAKTIPGFGGLLDVIDSVLFAAPIAYVWFG
jgi:phosphatidate cytidylyltransferase